MACVCCGEPLDPTGACVVCDVAMLVSPPHPCLRWLALIGDEHGCDPSWRPLGPDHETGGGRIPPLRRAL